MPELSPPTVVILLILVGTVVSLPIAAIVDAVHFSHAQWQQVGHNRTTWVALMALGILPCGIVGAVVAVEYLRTVRPKLLLAPG
jgi:hypothetical protein